jgi:hypothetical protein
MQHQRTQGPGGIFHDGEVEDGSAMVLCCVGSEEWK